MCTPFSPPLLHPPSLSSSQWYTPAVFAPLFLSLSPLLNLSGPHTGADAGAVSIHTCTCLVFWGDQHSLKTPSTPVCKGCCELIHARMCAWASFVPRSMCTDWKTQRGCMVGRICRDRWSLWCTILVLSVFPSLQFGCLARTNSSVLPGCPPHLVQEMEAKGVLVSDVFKFDHLCIQIYKNVSGFSIKGTFFNVSRPLEQNQACSVTQWKINWFKKHETEHRFH